MKLDVGSIGVIGIVLLVAIVCAVIGGVYVIMTRKSKIQYNTDSVKHTLAPRRSDSVRFSNSRVSGYV